MFVVRNAKAFQSRRGSEPDRFPQCAQQFPAQLASSGSPCGRQCFADQTVLVEETKDCLCHFLGMRALMLI